MRKFSILLISTLFLVTLAQARFYLGIEGGYLGSKTYQDSSGDGTFIVAKPGIIADAFSNSFKGFNTSLSIGTESFFGDYFGIRLDFLTGYNQMSQNFGSLKAQFNLINTSLYFDILVNFLKTNHIDFGFIGGVGADIYYRINYLNEINNNEIDDLLFSDSGLEASKFYTDSTLTSKALINLAGRIGFTMLVAKHHRLEFITKLPIASISSFPFVGGNLNLANVTLNAGYRFIF